MDTNKLYYSIGEVSKIADLKQYVLRYWETEFPMLHPNKNSAGNRIYREKDIELIREIKHLLYDRKFTIEGARQYFKSKPAKDTFDERDNSANSLNAISKLNPTSVDVRILGDLKSGLNDLLQLIKDYKNEHHND